MDQILATESLLPWLDPESSKIYLKFSAPGAASSVSAIPPDFPFVDASSPLARLIPASFTDGSPQTVKDVFLLMPKDRYTFAETRVPFSNLDIDVLWQQAGQAAALSASAPGGAAMPLWRSLFYCRHRQRYFHPPCPRCGKWLELCTADEVLLAAGLPAYSAGLQRFLFCHSCQIASGQTDFFAFAAPDTAAPPVKNHRLLINEFAYLIKNNVAVTGFPCRGCGQSGECFGPGGSAADSIIPLAFYPFRMIVTPARQLQAGDFLSLLAGASAAELAARLEAAGLPGRAACVKALGGRQAGGVPLFFQDARRFLELLSLKLALLAQVSGATFAAMSHLQQADLRLTLDQFWVDFADYEGPLPYFWNFRAMPLAIGLTPPQSVFLKVPESLGIQSLALLWFDVLLANSRLGAGDIARALAGFYERQQPEEEPDFLAAAGPFPEFASANIFWQPAPQQLPAAWLALWQQALALGWSLLRQSCRPVADFSAATFTARLASLAGEVKQSLFAVEAVPVMAMAAEDSDAAIRRILLGIRQRWETELPAAAPVTEVAEAVPAAAAEHAPAPPQQGEMEKTVLLSADQLATLMGQQTQSAGGPKTAAADDEVPPTIRPGAAPATAPAGEKPGKTRADGEAGLEKTVIMGAEAVAALLAGRNGKAPAPGEKKPVPAKPQLPDAAQAGLSETVMISPQQLAALRKLKKDDK